MDNSQRTIKRDLLYLYNELYKSVNSGNSSLFDKRIVNRLKHPLKDVEQALELENNSNSTKKNESATATQKNVSTLQITSINDLRNFFDSELHQLYDHTVDEKIKSEILKSVSLDELKRLYAIILSAPLSRSVSKKEIVDMLRFYFNDESRTKSIFRDR